MKAKTIIPEKIVSWRKRNSAKLTLSVRAVGFVAALGVVAHLGLARNDTEGFREFEAKQEVAKQKMYVCGVPEKEYGACIMLPTLKTEKTASVAPSHTQEEAELVAKVIAGNPDAFDSDTEMAAIAWVVLNRVDSSEYPDSIEGVVTEGGFDCYKESNLVYKHIEDIAVDVLIRWNDSKAGFESERVLPADYIYFDTTRNGVRFENLSGKEWDWSIDSPYET